MVLKKGPPDKEVEEEKRRKKRDGGLGKGNTMVSSGKGKYDVGMVRDRSTDNWGLIVHTDKEERDLKKKRM
jgi:hypothetical protein